MNEYKWYKSYGMRSSYFQHYNMTLAAESMLLAIMLMLMAIMMTIGIGETIIDG